jgi:hypothetical protein
VSDVVVVVVMALVAVGAAALSLLAWHRLTRTPGGQTEVQKPQFDSEDPDV